ncbi:MAG: acyl-CoA dehydrogenase family protein [Candidatus Sericytochromatia bacterium]|uniref:Acyl-CoA dehydrogenase family protein n=1 Tax=Candidatus Tanganyikabacteria bacterium TaxID=2961651 RepID=A0A937X453_9BACT|nr:acyl-CoA dehydrogenase family protein [Candidatus Tanganyikabacteria bacterium]
MGFGLTEEQEMLRSALRDFSAREVAPIAAEYDDRDEFPMHLWTKLGDLGFLGIGFPEAYGGSGGGFQEVQIAGEELAYASFGIALSIFAHTSLACRPILQLGTQAQQRRYLPDALRGLKIGAWGLTEPDAGSDVAGLKTRAVRQGDHWILNGSKMFCTNGNICNFVVAAARTDPDAGMKGISLFIVDRGTPGLHVSRKLKKISCKASDTAEVVFTDCKVPADALLGPPGSGFIEALKTLEGGRVIAVGAALGIARAAMDTAMKYARERMAFGQSIGKFQAIQFKFADMATEIEAARCLGQKVAWLADSGLPCAKEASMSKLFSSEMCKRVVNEALQVFGGYGLMMEFDVQRYWRDAKLLEIGEGTSEIQRGIIAKHLGL